MSASNKRNKRKQTGMISSRSTPAAKSYKVKARMPKITTSGRSTIIDGHELVSTISGSTVFNSTRFRINPGLGQYPWLSDRSRGWEQYRFESLRYEYIPSNAVTTTAGSVYLVADYDPSDPPPASLADLSTYETQENSRVYEKCGITLSVREMYRAGNGKKIRCGPVAGDLTLYDSGSVSVGTIDCTTNNPIGQLWIFYRVRLFSPQVSSSFPIPNGLSIFNLGASQGFSTGVGAKIDFDEAIVNGMELDWPSSVILPCGAYKVTGNCTFQASTASDFNVALEIQKNGASLSPIPIISESESAVPSGGFVNLTVIGYVVSSGTDTIDLFATLVGSGTLSARSDKCRLIVEVVSGG